MLTTLIAPGTTAPILLDGFQRNPHGHSFQPIPFNSLQRAAAYPTTVKRMLADVSREALHLAVSNATAAAQLIDTFPNFLCTSPV
jgi:hypothetical protein